MAIVLSLGAIGRLVLSRRASKNSAVFPSPSPPLLLNGEIGSWTGAILRIVLHNDGAALFGAGFQGGQALIDDAQIFGGLFIAFERIHNIGELFRI